MGSRPFPVAVAAWKSRATFQRVSVVLGGSTQVWASDVDRTILISERPVEIPSVGIFLIGTEASQRRR